MSGWARCASRLACPLCGRGMRADGGTIACPQGHSFDLARSGYVNLIGGSPPGRIGDTPEMVRARRDFLGGGHMRPLEEAVSAAAGEDEGEGVIVDIGTGTGRYLELLRRKRAAGARAPCALGFDISKAAAAVAAREWPSCLFAVADVQDRVPVAEAGADLVISVFAPRPASELARISADGATVLVAAAGETHLRELRRRFDLLAVRAGKLDELRARLRPAFDLEDATTHEWGLVLSPEACRAAVMMGPNARHRDRPPDPGAPIADTASVLLARFRRRPRRA